MARETINGISVPIPGTGEPADFVGDLRQIATDLSAYFGQVLNPMDFGAVGDGSTDDQSALAATIAALRSGGGLFLPPDKTFAHSDVLDLNVEGLRLFGGGALKATDQTNSAVYLSADGQIVENVHSICAATTRGSTLDHHAWVLTGAGTIIRKVTVTGSHATGFFAYGASDYQVDQCIVDSSKADAFHHTHGSHAGLVRNCRAINPGDDGHAVISYGGDGICYGIRAVGFYLDGQTGGRGMSVVGGEDITYEDFELHNTWGAAVYVFVEAGYEGIDGVRARRGLIVGGNQGFATLEHGDLFMGNEDATASCNDVGFSDIELRDSAADWPMWRRQLGAGAVTNTGFENIRLRGAFPPFITNDNVDLTDYHNIDYGRRATAARPVAGNMISGATYFDSTLNRRGYATGSAWKDGAGTTI